MDEDQVILELVKFDPNSNLSGCILHEHKVISKHVKFEPERKAMGLYVRWKSDRINVGQNWLKQQDYRVCTVDKNKVI